MKIIFIAITITITCHCDAQLSGLGTWNVVDGLYKPNNSFTIWTELQARSQIVLNNFYYNQFKLGLFYNFPKSDNALFVGGGRYNTYQLIGNFKSPTITTESRIWEQVTLNNQYDHLKIEHRYRLEQRWVNNNFRSRLRYRINPTFNLNHSKISPHTFFISCFDELFLGNNNPQLETNRYYIGLGYQFSKIFTLQIGSLRESNFNSTGKETYKNYLHTSLQIVIDNKSFQHLHPDTIIE